MLEEILPAGVTVVACSGDVDAELFPDEEAAIGAAVESRRREFATARFCARAALARVGLASQAIPVGPHGNPLWPAGIVGSITHCRGYRAAAVAREADLATIGIDAEPSEPLPDGVLGDIALPLEIEWLRECALSAPDVCWDRLLFCIKEAVYKACFPLSEMKLGFDDAIVMVHPAQCAFTARLLVPGAILGRTDCALLSGRWLIREGLVLTAIAH